MLCLPGGPRHVRVQRRPRDGKQSTGHAGCKVAVLCIDGAVVNADAGELTVADRSHLYPGQIVVSASDPVGQMGVVLEIDTKLDLVQFGDSIDNGGEPAVDVSAAEVRRVRELNAGDYVVFGGQWLGRVAEVSSVDAGAATCMVDWLASAALGTNREDINQPPARQQGSHDLALFSSGHHGWSVGDSCFFRGTPMSVSDTRTTADVVWQRGVASALLLPWEILNGVEFFPGKWVLNSGLFDDDDDVVHDDDEDTDDPVITTEAHDASDDDWSQPLLVVTSFNSVDKSVGLSCRGQSEVLASAYDLYRDCYQQVFYGDVVVRLRPPSDDEGERAGDGLSWVGHVTDLCIDGHVQVKWVNGNTSKVII